MTKEVEERETLPEMINAHVLMNRFHLSRCMTYQLLNRSDCGVVHIGRRKFIHRDTFLKWLEKQATGNQTE